MHKKKYFLIARIRAIMKNAASYIPVSTRRLYSSAIVWFIKLRCSFQQYNWKLWFSSIGASFNCI